MKFFKETSTGKWIVGNFTFASGTISAEQDNLRVSFSAPAGIRHPEDSYLYTELTKEDGQTYADKAEFDAATASFFVNATQLLEARVAEMEQLEAGKIAEALFSYGVRIDSNFTSPQVNRIGNMALHQSLPIQTNMRGCLVSDTGVINYYLDPVDWTKKTDGTDSNLTGADGQVMVVIPRFYYKANQINEKVFELSISSQQILGFVPFEQNMIGAYKATLQRSSLKLSSVVNTDADYRGGDNNATFDLLSSTRLGTPASSINLTNFRAYARNRGSRFSPVYYDLRKWLYWLFVIEYANLNSQAPVAGRDAVTGFMTGGLGDGFTTAVGTEWTAFNGYNPACKCGTTNSLANGSGEVNFTVNDFGGVGVNRTFKANRYRGIENPFGDIWEWTDGVLINVTATESKLYTAANPANFSSDSFANYNSRGNLSRVDGYMKVAKLGVNADILPQEIGGGSTTYYCDYYYQSNTPSLRGVYFGGTAHNGAGAGLVCANAFHAPSTALSNFGSRLCFV